MTAMEALQAARAVGVDVVLHGNDLALEASSPPPDAVLEALSRNKAEIVALLRAGDDGWNAEDWQVYFDERAGIAEFDGGLSRSQAEARAFACCVTELMNRNPQTSSPDRCLACGGYDSTNPASSQRLRNQLPKPFEVNGLPNAVVRNARLPVEV